MKTEIYTLNQLGTVSRGKSKHRPRNDAILYGGNYPFIQTGDIKHSSMYITEYSQTYNETGLAQSKLWDEDTLCITIAANIAETAILKIKACFPDSIVGFIANKEKADVRFLKYYFDIYKLYMQNISKGTTQDNFSLEKMLRVKFNIPSLSIQQKIANILSRYDEAIENNNKRIKLLEQMAQNLYKEWFVRFRFPGWQNVEFENGIPKGWKVEKLGNLLKRLSFGKTYKKDELEKEGNVIVIDQSTDDYLGFHNEEPSHKADFENPIILFGDHSCKFVFMTKNFSLGENVIPIQAKDCNSYFFYKAIDGIIETTEYKRHWSMLCSQKILIPSEDLQNEFCIVYKSFVKQIESLKTKNQNLAKQRDLLLPRLMSGKLEVK